MTPAKPTIDECIADSEADVMLFAQIPEAEKQLAIATANLDFLRAHKRITEAAGRPEPVAVKVMRDENSQTHDPETVAYIDALLAYADRVAAERDALRVKLDNKQRTLERYQEEAAELMDEAALLGRAETAERQLAELQAKHDALVAMTSAVCEKDPVGCWRVRCHLGKDCAANKELLAAMSAVALDKEGE